MWTRRGIRVNTGCCDVCGEWVTVCGGHSWYWACGAISFLAGWDVLRSLVPHPGLTCWAMTTKQMASIAAHSDLWPLAFELPCREELLEKPSWFNNIFSPGAAKALSCLTPVAPSVDLQHNCSYLPYILTQCAVVCHACSSDTSMQRQFVRFMWEWQKLHEWYLSWNLFGIFGFKICICTHVLYTSIIRKPWFTVLCTSALDCM